MEYAFPILSDIHDLQGNLASRRNYQAESDHVFNKIIDVIVGHRDKGRKVIPIFLGDIFHNSFKGIFDGIEANNKYIALRRILDDMLAVAGNHEFTYYTDNPFWTLFNDIESSKIKRILNKAWKPRGKVNSLRVPDIFECGDVVFHFNHYGTKANVITDVNSGKVNIGLFHQDMYAKEIVQEVTLTKGLSIYNHGNYIDITEGPMLYGYDHAFFGHMHKLYGEWTYFCERTHWTTELHYLASLGRTNVTEVDNNFLERNIPSVIVRDGEYSGIEDFKFNLMTREECVIEESVIINRIKYEKAKETKEMVTMSRVADKPLDNVRANLASSPVALSMFDDIIEKPVTDLENEIISLIEKVQSL